jgi:cytochrome b561
VEPVSMKRVLFWASFVLATIAFVFGLLLAQVPRPRHNADFRLDLMVWSSCSCLLLIALLLARKILDVKNWEKDGTPIGAYRLFSFLAFSELLFCLYAVVSLFM